MIWHQSGRGGWPSVEPCFWSLFGGGCRRLRERLSLLQVRGSNLYKEEARPLQSCSQPRGAGGDVGCSTCTRFSCVGSGGGSSAGGTHSFVGVSFRFSWHLVRPREGVGWPPMGEPSNNFANDGNFMAQVRARACTCGPGLCQSLTRVLRERVGGLFSVPRAANGGTTVDCSCSYACKRHSI